jgi:hypothetical protein
MFSSTALTDTAAAKTTVLEVSKPELFAGSRFKFKVFCTQVRLGIWTDTKRPIDKRLIRYTDDHAL